MGSDIEVWEGDCRELMKAIPEGSVDAIVTDPPYGTEALKDGYGRRQNYGGVGRGIEGDSSLDVFAAMLALVPRVLKANTWVVCFCSPKRHAEAAGLLANAGFPVAGEIVWDKLNAGLGGGIRYQHETALLAKHGNPAGRSSLFSVIRSHLSRENKANRHPHEKPVDLMRELVRYASRPGETVLDPFVGSGSTLVACRKSGRDAVGIEIDPRYAAIARRRVAEAATPLFDGLPAEVTTSLPVF